MWLYRPFWCNVYRQNKCIRWSRKRLFAFCIGIVPLRKVWFLIVSTLYGKTVSQTVFLNLGLEIRVKEWEHWIQISCSPLKNWPCITSCSHWRNRVNTYIWINVLFRLRSWSEYRMKMFVSVFIIFTNPSARAGYDTRSIFKLSFTSLNSEFSFS